MDNQTGGSGQYARALRQAAEDLSPDTLLTFNRAVETTWRHLPATHYISTRGNPLEPFPSSSSGSGSGSSDSDPNSPGHMDPPTVGYFQFEPSNNTASTSVAPISRPSVGSTKHMAVPVGGQFVFHPNIRASAVFNRRPSLAAGGQLDFQPNNIRASTGFPATSRATVAAADPEKPAMIRVLTAGRIEQDAPGLVIPGTSKIWGITNDPEEEKIYAADRDGHAILVFCTSRGQIALQAKFAAPVPIKGLPFRPTGIHFCKASNLLYVTDKDNHRVCIFKTDGRLVSSFGTNGHKDGQFNYPWGVAVSPDGELIAVADSKNHRLQLFNKAGLFLRKYTVFELNPYEYRSPTDGLDYPRGVCFDDTGSTVFISDFNLHNVIAVEVKNLKARVMLCPLRRLTRPQGITMDLSGNLLVCDSRAFGGGAIQMIRPGGIVEATVEGTSNTRFQLPCDVTVCFGGCLCVVDCGGTRLQIF